MNSNTLSEATVPHDKKATEKPLHFAFLRFAEGDQVFIRPAFAAKFGATNPGRQRHTFFTIKSLLENSILLEGIGNSVPPDFLERVHSGDEIKMLENPLPDHRKFMEVAHRLGYRVQLYHGDFFWAGPAAHIYSEEFTQVRGITRTLKPLLGDIFKVRCMVDQTDEPTLYVVRPMASDFRLNIKPAQ